jgi:hypothetical protein
MTTTPEQDTPAEQSTVENADGARDGVDGAPQGEAPVEEELTPRQVAARKAAATRRARAGGSDDETPDELRKEQRAASTSPKHDKDAIVHLYEFENGYAAKVYQRHRGGAWEWAPMRDGKIVRNLPGVGRVPAAGTAEQINDGLALVAALDA